MKILKVSHRPDLKEEDFVLHETAN
jgi:hypothetical protein